jgi:hypothetical protein
MERSCGCDWPDLQVDRTVRMNGGLIACDAVHRNSVHRVTWRNGIKAQIVSRAEMCWGFNLVW